jgi:5-(carboxyamino)imidazole ribonucleotide synthase
MLAQAAAKLGLQCHVYSSEADTCSFQVVQRATLADFSDQAALEKFARDCDVITYEFENVPASAAAFLAQRKTVLPDPKVLETTQDRLIEKNFIRKLKIETVPYAAVNNVAQLVAAITDIGVPAVLKTRRLGYDGKGQVKILKPSHAAAAWRAVGEAPSILEGFLNFECEVSVVAARTRDGHVECFDVTENEHRNHILKISRAPARIPTTLAAEAHRIAKKIAKAFNFVGVLGVEMFVIRRGRTYTLMVNEIAPRVHNSGHWTIEGATVSQFEQHIRAIAGWPLGKPVRLGSATMMNLIGPEVGDYARLLKVPGTSVHLYGKGEGRPGRKMGHVTTISVK